MNNVKLFFAWAMGALLASKGGTVRNIRMFPTAWRHFSIRGVAQLATVSRLIEKTPKSFGLSVPLLNHISPEPTITPW